MTLRTERTIANAILDIHDAYRTGVIKSRMPKMSQLEFIQILFDDLHFNAASQRKAWLHMRYQKNYADELTVAEASDAIDKLKAQKEGNTGVREEE